MFDFEAAEEVCSNVFRGDVIAEDDVKIYFVPAGVSAAERVESELDDRQDEIDIGEVAALVLRLDNLVALDRDVIVDAEDFDRCGKLAELIEVGVPAFRSVPAGELLLKGLRCVDMEIPSTPEAAARIMPVESGRGRAECAPPVESD